MRAVVLNELGDAQCLKGHFDIDFHSTMPLLALSVAHWYLHSFTTGGGFTFVERLATPYAFGSDDDVAGVEFKVEDGCFR